MNKIFLSTAAFSHRPGVETALEYHKHGIENSELSGGTFLKNQVDLIKEIKNIHFNLHNYFPPPENPFVINLATKNEKILNATEKHIFNAIDLAEHLKLKDYSFHAGFLVDPKPDDLGKTTKSKNFIDREEGLKIFVKRIEKISNYANKKKINLLIENNVMKKSSYDFLKRNVALMAQPDEIQTIMSKTPTNINLLLDVAHLKVSSNVLNFDLNSALDKINPWVRAYHFSDNNGYDDSNDLIKEDSWFMNKIKKDAIFYTVEVYNKDINKLKKQIDIIKLALK